MIQGVGGVGHDLYGHSALREVHEMIGAGHSFPESLRAHANSK